MTRSSFIACGILAAFCLALGCRRNESSRDQSPLVVGTESTVATRYPVVIRKPPVPQGASTATLDPHGNPVSLSCAACHSVRAANVTTSQSTDLDEFHQGLKFVHGQLTCVSCHHASDNYSSLRLADGRSVPFSESMTLCAQCHGTQYRDYQHGSHGGMTGHWDLTRGGRERNHCLHCHDAHAPKYPTFTPVAGPRDRFRPVASSGVSHE
jgi:hypothetical protein